MTLREVVFWGAVAGSTAGLVTLVGFGWWLLMERPVAAAHPECWPVVARMPRGQFCHVRVVRRPFDWQDHPDL